MEKEEPENKFVDKMKRWKKTHRSDWRWSHRPSHRDVTVGAFEQTESLKTSASRDALSLRDIEESLAAMNGYVEVEFYFFFAK